MKGVKYDTGKDRWDLLPLKPLRYVVKVLTKGVKKYAPDNWKKVKNSKERYYSAMMRHIVSHKNEEWLDKETKLPHLAHALCCLIFWFWHELKGRQ